MNAIKKKKTNSLFSTGLAILVALMFRSSIASPYVIPSGSMIPTIKIGDHIFANKLAYGIKIPFTNHNLIDFHSPERGDVVVVIEPLHRKIDLLKRVIGVQGDIIELRNDQLFINGKIADRLEIHSPTLLQDSGDPTTWLAPIYLENIDGRKHLVVESDPIPSNFGPILVPEGSLFLMGDNRDNSSDSRMWGFLPVKNVRGKAMFTWLSLNWEEPLFRLTDRLAIPSIRFDRFGKKVI